MKLSKAILLSLILVISAASAQRSFQSYYDMKDFLQASPGAFKFGLYGFDNPAMTSYLQDADIMFGLSGKVDNGKIAGYQRWGLFTGSPYSGLGIMSTSAGDKTVIDYRYTFAFGSRTLGFGLGYGFTGGDKGFFGRSNVINAGFLSRPSPYVSFGMFGTVALEKSEYEAVIDLAVRPFKNYLLTFFGDYGMFNNQNLSAGNWSAGVSWEFLDGLRLNGRYFKDKSLSLGLDVSFGTVGVSALVNENLSSSKMTNNTYMFRSGAIDRSAIKDIFVGPKKFAKIDLSGIVKYQKFIYFDNSHTLLSILNQLDEVKKDKSIEGILVNATNLMANKEILWEIREKLTELKSAGKKVVVFIERANIDLYDFASVADNIVLDPLGQIGLDGYMLGRSFYKTMLEKIGVGFEEIRLFKYKSAVENFARDKMSDADREQRQAMVDDWYSHTKESICAARKFAPAEFDSLVNKNIVYMADQAKTEKLIDLTGRWINAEEITNQLYGKIDQFVSTSFQRIKPLPIDDKWGKPVNKIAIVYAIGECAMETGIKARTLVNDLKKAMDDPDVSAIVLRVDSPGGDAMASDYIADVLRKNKGKKPVIVSQGMVAGSGGYWLSMDGDMVLAAPMTITGSIGVISAFIYDKGLEEKLGITTDLVMKGKYADLGFSFALPFIGLGLPVRDLTQDERSKMESSIMDMYKDFVGKVATGRKMKYDDIQTIAQGRIWSGTAGKKIGLVDEIGGLDAAIKLAKAKSGFKPDDDCSIVEYPALGFFDFNMILSSLFGVQTVKEDKTLNSLKFLLKNNGTPMPVMPVDYMELAPVE